VLLGVSCSSSTACTAVGYYKTVDSMTVAMTLAERWDGAKWSVQTTPNAANYDRSYLNAVSCAAGGCIALGYAQDNVCAGTSTSSCTRGLVEQTGSLPSPHLARRTRLLENGKTPSAREPELGQGTKHRSRALNNTIRRQWWADP
jgi:hypothetical protein